MQLFSPKGPRSGIALAVLVVLVFSAAAFSLGMYFGSEGRQLTAGAIFSGPTLPPAGVDLDPLWEAWSVLNEKFVSASSTGAVTNEEMLWGAIQGLAGSMGDPYTVFLPPEDAAIFQEDISGNFEGVGMEIGIRDEVLTVIAPLEGTPAKAAGILSGDKILKIDEQETADLTIDQAVKIIRGEQGTEVRFIIAREGEESLLEIPVVRDVIEIPTIDIELREDGIFVVSLYNFSATSPTLFRDALRQFIESGSNDLILDLRGNPGGFLEASIDMASWFLPAGKVVVREDFGGDREEKVHRSRGYDIFNDSLDMAILVNQGSASASEILAGALQEHDVATLVGESTFGKGSVQELVPITDTASLKVTIARWLTPEGKSISEGGLAPDVPIEMTVEDIEVDRDPQLSRAAALLLSR